MKRREFFETIGLATVAAGFAGSIPGISCGSKRLSTEKGMNVKFEVKRLNLTQAWTISRNSSNYKDNIFVYLEKDRIVGIGEAASNIRYNETPELTIEVIKKSIPLFENCNPLKYVQLSYDIKSLTTE